MQPDGTFLALVNNETKLKLIRIIGDEVGMAIELAETLRRAML